MIVSDTGPLIALAKIEGLELLRGLFDAVLIPQSVLNEISAKSGVEVERIFAALGDYLRVQEDGEIVVSVRGLGVGEQQAMLLAQKENALLLADDWRARQAAQALGLAVTGTIGILLLAKEKSLVAAVRPLLEEMRRAGYWLADDLVDAATRLAGES